MECPVAPSRVRRSLPISFDVLYLLGDLFDEHPELDRVSDESLHTDFSPELFPSRFSYCVRNSNRRPSDTRRNRSSSSRMSPFCAGGTTAWAKRLSSTFIVTSSSLSQFFRRFLANRIRAGDSAAESERPHCLMLGARQPAIYCFSQRERR